MTDVLLSRLDKVRANGDRQWVACCPAHPDRTPSLHIKETSRQQVLIHCFAGCEAGDIMAAVGMTLADLYPSDQDNVPPLWWARKERRNEEAKQKKLDHERLILELCAYDREQGRRLSRQDLERERQAWLRVNGKQ